MCESRIKMLIDILKMFDLVVVVVYFLCVCVCVFLFEEPPDVRPLLRSCQTTFRQMNICTVWIRRLNTKR